MWDEAKSADIINTLNDILAHKIFAASPKAQDFLRHIISETLAERGDTLTGVTIAQDVFQKDENFDAIQDSVVRVTARRVRYMLQDYYAQKDTNSSVIITIPKGKYKPHFEYQDIAPAPLAQNLKGVKDSDVKALARPRKLFWAAGIFAILMFVFAAMFIPSKLGANAAQYNDEISSYPSIAIIPFTNQTDDNSFSFLEQSLQKQMTEDLSRFALIRPTSYDKPYETLLKEESSVYDYAITGVMLGVEPEIDLYIKLIDLNETTVIFEDRIRRTPGQSQYYDALFNIVSDLSGNFAGLEGVIVKERLGSIQNKIEDGTKALSDLTAFECNSLIDKLIKAPSPELYKTIYNCLEAELKTKPKDDTLLASLGWITYVGATSHEPVLMARSINPDINADEGLEMIKRAVTLNPENAWAQQTLSSLKIHKGDIEGALKHAELAVLENPANPDNLTWLSQCLAHAGQWDRAIKLAQEAIDRNPTPPSQYYYTFFLKGLNDGDTRAMNLAAATLTSKDNYYAKLYSYLAAVSDNNISVVRTLKPHIDEMAKRNNDDIMSVIATRMPSSDLQQKAKRLIVRGENMLSEAPY